MRVGWNLGITVCVAVSCLVLGRPAPAGEGEQKDDKKEHEKDSGATPKAVPEPAAKADSKPEEKDAKPRKPASTNLTVPADLPADAKKALEEAIEAFKAAEKATAGSAQAFKQSVAKLKAASQKASKSPLPLYYLGMAYQGQRNFKEAKTVLEKAVKLNPQFHEALVELGDVYVWQKKLKEAIPQYEKALSLEPLYAHALDNKAFALIQMGDFAGAKTTLLEAEKLQKEPGRVYYMRQVDREIQGPGWKPTFTVETENYIVTTGISEEFAKEIANNAELIRRAYNVVFSGIAKPDRKYAIWVYESVDAYHAAGNSAQALGHYDLRFRKLVVPRQKNKAMTYTVLYHEAFHQYLHNYLELAPQWFNEGLGDYFGAFEYSRVAGKEKMLSKPNKGRLNNAQYAIQAKILPPAAELMVMSQQEMYEPKMASFHYAESWAIMYFLIQGNKPEYKRVLISYFDLLRKGKDRNEAYEQTFGKIDMAKFDLEWKGYIANLSRD